MPYSRNAGIADGALSTTATCGSTNTGSASTTGSSLRSTEALGNTQDANYAQVATEYTSDQVAYEAALNAGGSIMQMSLLEFLK